MILVIGAMNEEVSKLIQQVDKYDSKMINQQTIYECEYHNIKFITILGGVGKVASAISLTTIFDHYDIDLVINMGTAGGIDSKLKTFDVVVAKEVKYWDIDLRAFGYQLNEPRFTYPTDENTNQLILEINQQDTYYGELISADTFTSETNKQLIRDNFPHALACDMEAGAIGQTCQHFNIPFVVIRGISDLIFNPNNSISFDEYVHQASISSSKLVLKLIEKCVNN
ncbi:MAG: 5'-methylthioadenosine/adenosylhomocysteine nucleosidase [Erysipelotrichaceae bacterium]